MEEELKQLLSPLWMYSTCKKVIDTISTSKSNILNELKGATVIVTGANSGIGKGTAKAFAEIGSNVIFACRSIKKAEEIIQEFKNIDKNYRLHAMTLDLNSLQSVDDFVSKLSNKISKNELPSIRAIICNAGIIPFKFKRTIEGVEQSFGVNYLGHYFLVNQLLKQKANFKQKLRVVIVSSTNHYSMLPNNDLKSRKNLLRDYARLIDEENSVPFKIFGAYGGSKICNVLHARKLNGLNINGIKVNAASCNPGIVYTNVGNENFLIRWLMPIVGPLFFKSIDQGASTSVLLGILDDKYLEKDLYFNANHPVKPSDKVLGKDGDIAKEVLWKLSEDLCNLFLQGKSFSEISLD